MVPATKLPLTDQAGTQALEMALPFGSVTQAFVSGFGAVVGPVAGDDLVLALPFLMGAMAIRGRDLRTSQERLRRTSPKACQELPTDE